MRSRVTALEHESRRLAKAEGLCGPRPNRIGALLRKAYLAEEGLVIRTRIRNYVTDAARPPGSGLTFRLAQPLWHPERPDFRYDERNVVVGGAEERLGFLPLARRSQHRPTERVDAMEQDRQ
jgi:hypothetical protein